MWFLVALKFDPLLLYLGLKVGLVGRHVLHVVHQLVGLLHHTTDRLLEAGLHLLTPEKKEYIMYSRRKGVYKEPVS
jgi:hypothetical protein